MIWYEGRNRLIVRKSDESSAELYQRVLEQVQDMRLAVRYGYWQGQELNFAHVYAGVKPSAADKRERMKEWCSTRLYDLAAHHSDGATRVAALGALAELYGLHAPRRYVVRNRRYRKQRNEGIRRRSESTIGLLQYGKAVFNWLPNTLCQTSSFST